MFDLNDNETEEIDRAILYALLKGIKNELIIAKQNISMDFTGLNQNKHCYFNKDIKSEQI